MKTIANIMLVLNEAEFIEAAIRSVLPSLDQLIVIDQGSTDGTQAILDRLDVTWVSTNGQNFLTRGEQFFRNLAIDLCFCDFLMVTDGDEVMGDGWEKEVRGFLDQCGDLYGAIRCNYWQMIGSSAYHSVDSPLRPVGGMRPLLFRKADSLCAGEPMTGTKVHTSIIGIDPPLVANLNVDLFHVGYCKNPTERFERNITRGDWTQNDAEKSALITRVSEDPFQFLMPCVPITFEKERLPASIREPKFSVDYDPATRRITGRQLIAH